MQTVQKIVVINDAGFNLSFHVEDQTGRTWGSETPSYPLGQNRTIDLKSDKVPEGLRVHPVIRAHVAGKHGATGGWVEFRPNSDVGTYRVSGGFANIKVELTGS